MSDSVSFKLYFSKSSNNNNKVDIIKRIRSSPTWKGFTKRLASLFPSSGQNYSFSISWRDEEGDVILVDTQREWEEALFCSPSFPLKLYVTISEELAEEEASDKTKEKEEEEEEEVSVPFPISPEYFYSELGDEHPSPDERLHLTNTIPRILSHLAESSGGGTLPVWVMESITATSASGDVLLDVNIPRFSYSLHSRALTLLVQASDELEREEEASSLDREAVSLLRHCVMLTPGDRNAHFYLSCGLSRLEMIEEALPPLEKYVALGGDVKNVYQDVDLKNVRDSPLFSEFAKRFPDVEEEEEEEEEEEKEAVVEDVVNVVVDDEVEDLEKLVLPEREKWEEEMKTLEDLENLVLPEREREKWEEEMKTLQELGIEEGIARILLEECGGDLDAVVDTQFQSQFF